MLQHKLNQAKKTRFQLKKYVHFQMFHFFSACPFPNPMMCKWTCLCTSSFWNIQTNKCLFGWCEAFVCAHLHLKQKHTLENNTKAIKIDLDDNVVIIPMHLFKIYICIYTYVYIPIYECICVYCVYRVYTRIYVYIYVYKIIIFLFIFTKNSLSRSATNMPVIVCVWFKSVLWIRGINK